MTRQDYVELLQKEAQNENNKEKQKAFEELVYPLANYSTKQLKAELKRRKEL